MEVVCRNGAFQIRLNGQTTVEGRAPAPGSGFVMLQSGSGGIEFRRLENVVPDKDASARPPTAKKAGLKPESTPSNPKMAQYAKPADPDALARKKLWAAAADAYEALLEKEPGRLGALAGLKLALLYAATGNRAAHTAHCRAMFDASKTRRKPGDGGRPAKAWAAFPDAMDQGLQSLAVEGAAYATQASTSPGFPWFSLTRAMVEYRRGNNEAVLKWLNKPLRNQDPALKAAALLKL